MITITTQSNSSRSLLAVADVSGSKHAAATLSIGNRPVPGKEQTGWRCKCRHWNCFPETDCDCCGACWREQDHDHLNGLPVPFELGVFETLLGGPIAAPPGPMPATTIPDSGPALADTWVCGCGHRNPVDTKICGNCGRRG